jgi:hypothetical protein
MTEVSDEGIGGPRRGAPHLGDLKLRRLFAGERLGSDHESAAAHASACGDCARRMAELAEEQRSFEGQISFDRFAAGVKRTARGPAADGGRSWWSRPASTRSFLTIMSIGSVAAVLTLVAGVRPLFESARLRHVRTAQLDRADSLNRLKGGIPRAAITVRVAAAEDETRQRTVATERPEPLTVGERIRVGVEPGTHGFLFAVSIDDAGDVTPLYPEVGMSMPLPRGARMQYLPDSLELTGRGRERLVVLLTDLPLELDTVRRAASTAFRAVGGNLEKLPNLALPGEQFHRLFLKP